jgi:hypothetical protein
MMLWAGNISCSVVDRSSFLVCFNRENNHSPEQFVNVKLKNIRSVVSTSGSANRILFLF